MKRTIQYHTYFIHTVLPIWQTSLDYNLNLILLTSEQLTYPVLTQFGSFCFCIYRSNYFNQEIKHFINKPRHSILQSLWILIYFEVLKFINSRFCLFFFISFLIWGAVNTNVTYPSLAFNSAVYTHVKLHKNCTWSKVHKNFR